MSLGNVGLAYGHMGDYESQLAFVLDALELRKRLFKNEKNLDMALSLNSVGYAYACIRNGNDTLALQYCLESYRIHRGLTLKPNVHVLRSAINVGICYFILRNFKVRALKRLNIIKNIFAQIISLKSCPEWLKTWL